MPFELADLIIFCEKIHHNGPSPSPTVDQQIRDALSLSEPFIAASSLLHVVKQQPDAETVSWIAELYDLLAIENPFRADALTQSLVLLRDFPDIPTITKNDYHGHSYQESFEVLLDLFLHEVLSAAVSGPSSDLFAVTPENSFLIGSVTSAEAAKQDLFISSRQVSAITRGIQFPKSEYEYSDPEGREVSCLGACLQLLIAGSVFSDGGHLGRNKEQLLPSIKSLAAKEIIKDPNGKRLLQVRTTRIFVPFCLIACCSLGHA